jgi:hypothetical protein
LGRIGTSEALLALDQASVDETDYGVLKEINDAREVLA